MHEKRIAKWTEPIRNAEDCGFTIKSLELWKEPGGISEKVSGGWICANA